MDTLGPPVAPRPFWTHNAHTAAHLPLTAGRGGVGCMDTCALTRRRALTSLACFSAFFAAFSASFCCFFRPFLDWACSSSVAALQQEEAHNINTKVDFHLLFLLRPGRELLLTAWENLSRAVITSSFQVDATF